MNPKPARWSAPAETIKKRMYAHTPQQFSYQAAIRKAVELSIAYPEGSDCRKYNIPLYTASPNIPDTYAATPGRAASLAGNTARPAAAGHALTQIMSQYATGRGYSIPAYESTVSEDNDVDRGRGVATDGGPTERSCPRCGNVHDRSELVPTPEGVRTCPDCGASVEPYADGGVSTVPTCAHIRTRRYGRTNDQGDAYVEVRCLDCGRTLSTGGDDR